MFYSAELTAHRLDVSKTHLLNCVRNGLVKPAPTKVNGKKNSPWLFSPAAKIIKKSS